MDELELSAQYLLNDEWGLGQPIPAESGAKSDTQEDEIRRMLRATRIEVAPQASTRVVSSKAQSTVLLSEVGMNIVVPQGTIRELRFKATLLADGEIADDLVVLDGFPKGRVEERYLVDGKITLGVSKLFQFIPAIGPVGGGVLGDLLQIDLNPWQFKIGHIRDIEVIFSGGLTFEPEWYFRQAGLTDELHVSMTIRKPASVRVVDAQVEAAWSYDPGFLRPIKVGTDAKTLRIFLA
ncbi:MAG: hypothetical protein M3178_09925 [Pseudomonadota bacterium]|nr:hypothetical protein [Pseudomonadota bacterium]